MQNNQSILTQASSMMIDAMKAVKDKKMEPKEAQAIAQLGIGVVQAAKTEVDFIRATKAVVRGGVLGDSSNIQFLEPAGKLPTKKGLEG